MKDMLPACGLAIAFFLVGTSVAHAACQSEMKELTGSPVKVEVCIAPLGMFKPNQVTASINGKKIFKGTDYADVVFGGRYNRQAVSGGCTELVTVMDRATMKGAPVDALPADLVEACRIAADADGNSSPFAKDAKCGKALYAALGPLSGKLAPVSDAKRCTVLLDGIEIFNQEFKL